MTKIASYPTTTSYLYDGQGNLAIRTTAALPRTSAIDDRTVYVGGIYEERSEYGIGINAKATVLYQAFGRVIATRTGTETTYLLADHLGSTVGTVSADGSEVHQVRYWPYGAVRSGGVGTDKMYTGQQVEAGSALGIHNYRARMYSDELGYFVSADSAASGTNRYSYVFNNPLRSTDPSGHDPSCGLLGCGFQSEEQLHVYALTMVCGSAFADCVFNLAGRNTTKFIGLVSTLFGVDSMLLAAVVLNEIAHLKLNDDPALAWATAHNPFSENWDRTWGIAELNPLAIVGNIETRWALPKADGLAGYISRLENPLWAVVYAAGWLGALSMRFAEQGVIATSDDLKIAYRGGAIYEGGVIDSRHRGQPYSAPAAAQLASVDAFYYAGNVDELAAQMFEHQESIVGKIFRLVDPITPRCLLC